MGGEIGLSRLGENIFEAVFADSLQCVTDRRGAVPVVEEQTGTTVTVEENLRFPA